MSKSKPLVIKINTLILLPKVTLSRYHYSENIIFGIQLLVRTEICLTLISEIFV